MGVSVVIPNYNGEKYLEKCLETLLLQTLLPEEIIIVDNASKDKSIDIINDRFIDKVTLIKMKENHGFSVAVNEGIKRNKSEFVVLLNNDTEVDRNWLEELYICISKDKSIFSCSSKMIRYDNRELIDDAGDEYTIFGWGKKRGDGASIAQYSNDEEIFSSCAGAAIYRASAFDEIGLFDEDFFAYLEDMDISYRARLHGYKNYYASKALVYHIGSATSGSRHNAFKVKLASRNNIFLIYKNMPFIQFLLNSLFILSGILIKYIYFITKGLGKDYISGVFEGIRDIKRVGKIRLKNNIKNYICIEIYLIKNTFSLLKRGY